MSSSNTHNVLFEFLFPFSQRAEEKYFIKLIKAKTPTKESEAKANPFIILFLNERNYLILFKAQTSNWEASTSFKRRKKFYIFKFRGDPFARCTGPSGPSRDIIILIITTPYYFLF